MLLHAETEQRGVMAEEAHMQQTSIANLEGQRKEATSTTGHLEGDIQSRRMGCE